MTFFKLLVVFIIYDLRQSWAQSSGGPADVSIYDDPSYTTLRSCAAGCIWYNGILPPTVRGYQDLAVNLGCGAYASNACYCSERFTASASSYLSSCVSADCSRFSDLTVDVSQAVGLYDDYCATANFVISTSSLEASTTSSSSSSSSSVPESTTTSGSSSVAQTRPAVTSGPSFTSTPSRSTTSASSSSVSIPAPSESAASKGLSKSATIGIGAGIGVGVPFIVIAIGFFWFKKRNNAKANIPVETVYANKQEYNPVSPPQYPTTQYPTSQGQQLYQGSHSELPYNPHPTNELQGDQQRPAQLP